MAKEQVCTLMCDLTMSDMFLKYFSVVFVDGVYVCDMDNNWVLLLFTSCT
jgi:hypothetical protein